MRAPGLRKSPKEMSVNKEGNFLNTFSNLNMQKKRGSHSHKSVEIHNKEKELIYWREKGTHTLTLLGANSPWLTQTKGLPWSHARSLLGSYLHKTTTLMGTEVDKKRFAAEVQTSGNSIREKQRMHGSGNIKNNSDGKCQRKCSHNQICCG